MEHPMRGPISGQEEASSAGSKRAGDYLVRCGAAWRQAVTVTRALLMLLFVSSLTACGEAGESAQAARAASDVPALPSSRGAPSPDAPDEQQTRPVIVFLGTSLTAGYGLEESQAFPALIQERVDAEGLDYRVVNAGVSGDTSAGGLRRLAWLLRLPIAVLVLELGANDMLRGQGVEALRTNLETILDRTREAHPDARFLIAGMRAAPNLGRDYVERFDAVYPALAEREQAALVPFLLEDVAARRHLNQADGIHPTAEGHALIAERVWRSLAPLLR
jgi:acyl-CoA thioesterase-1